MRTRVAAIVLGAGVVALAIWLWWGARERVAARESGAEGAADATPPAPAPGLARAQGPAVDRAAGRRPDAGAEADEGDAEDENDAEEPIARSLRVYAVDGATGAPVAARWHWRGPPVAGPFSRDQVLDAATLAAAEENARKSEREYLAGFLASGERAADVLRDGRPLKVHLRPPAGYVIVEDQTVLATPFAADVRDAWAVVPLHREAVLDVHVLAPDGAPAEGVTVAAATVAGESSRLTTETLAPGELRLRGIPHLPGETLALGLDWGPAPRASDELVLEVEEGISSPEVATTIPMDLATRWTALVQLKGPVAHLMDHNEISFDADLLDSEPPPAVAGAPRGRIRVQALGWDGQPAVGATVFGKAGDAHGVVFLDDVSVGELTLWAAAPGRFPAAGTAAVRDGKTTEVVLREPLGARLEVSVVDEEGRPRPFASLRVSRATFDVGERGQRLDPFTDENGRRSFARVEPGEAKVSAQWGSRHGSATVLLRDGERSAVRVVAK